MIRGEIITYWTIVNNVNVPYFVNDDLLNVWSDISGQAPVPQSPNSVVLRILVSENTFNLIQNDNDIYILWDEPNPKNPYQIPDNAEFGQLTSFLAQQRYSLQQIRNAVGSRVDNRNRLEIANSLRNWLYVN